MFFSFLEAVVNIPIQTLMILPRLLFREMITSQLELGSPVLKQRFPIPVALQG